MKCLGALDGFIIKLFLIESLFQGAVGTAIGIVVGILLSLLSVLTTYGGFAWKNVLWGDIGLALGGCMLVGVILTVAGALYPAWQAARMQPIEAMRAVLFDGELPAAGDAIYTLVAAAVALAAGALVFSRSDDRIAVEV